MIIKTKRKRKRKRRQQEKEREFFKLLAKTSDYLNYNNFTTDETNFNNISIINKL